MQSTRKDTGTLHAAAGLPQLDWTAESLQQRFGDALTVDRKLGEGAMGAVFLAHDRTRSYALKVLVPTALASSDTLRRFILEGKLLQELDHPNILKVHQVGEEPTFPYLLCDFVEGESLDKLIEREAPFAWPRALQIVTQVLAGLVEAHSRKIIHRDIKPSNVLMDGEGRCRLADFGIAKADRADTQKTSTGIVMGTPTYMAPELVLGARATEAADVYAVGTMLFELLAGTTPFPGDDVTQMFTAKIKSHAPRLSDVATGAPRPLDRLVSMALAREIPDRIPSAVAFLREIEDARRTVAQLKPGNASTRAVSTHEFVGLKPSAQTRVEAGAASQTSRVRAIGRAPAAPAPGDPASWKPVAVACAMILGLVGTTLWVRAGRERSAVVIRPVRAPEAEPAEPLSPAEFELARSYSVREDFVATPKLLRMPDCPPVRAAMILRQAMKSGGSPSLKSLLARKAGETGEPLAVDALVEALTLSVPQDERQQSARLIVDIVTKATPAPPASDLFDRNTIQLRFCNIITETANGVKTEDPIVIEAAVVTLGWLAPRGADTDCLTNMLPAVTRCGWLPGPGHGDPTRSLRKTLEAIGTPGAKKALEELRS